MRNPLGIGVGVLLALSLAACGDDDPTGPGSGKFVVHIVVSDVGGRPVAGLKASVSPDLGALVPWPYAVYRPTAQLFLCIYDLDGRLVRRIEGGDAWTGRDDAGRTVHDGVYRRVRTCTDGDGGEVTEESYSYFITGDPEFHTSGVTDATGRFSIWDRTYVPAFFGLDAVEYISYGGQTNQAVPSPRTRLTLLAEDGSHQSHSFDAVDAAQTLHIVWDPDPPAAAPDGTPPCPERPLTN